MSAASIPLTENPLYTQGYGPVRHKRRFGYLTLAPKIPLYQLSADDLRDLHVGLGDAGPTAMQTGGTTAMTIAPMTGPAAPFVFAAGVLMKIIGSFWAKHDARVAGAKLENVHVNSAVIAWDQSMQAIFAAANSSDPSQQISPAIAAQQVQAQYQQFWAVVSPFTHGPGEADASYGGLQCSGMKCNKGCTAGCCVGCLDLYPAVQQAVAAFQAGGGTVTVPKVFPSKYGVKERDSYNLTYTVPAAASTASGILAALTGGTSGSSLSSSLLPIAALAVVALLVLK